ncbi:rhomboid family intramembrane serine protease [Rhodobacteraceae bacterium RKSG542]|uniref:rhomboid family intramembrane serine protease n=1 Tax=Pseudovibrio flavus TaxID=2529854 RepID=UPI0012BB4DAA|nr:rhomboid family intramembrane serine protease [Pseudovibrio flavus]MTI19361.1 rhomboid family intramembrane serine protease [Pseudovibrio flavus]
MYQNETPKSEPVFNLPTVIVALGLILVAVHLVRTYLLTMQQDFLGLLLFAFWPVRYVEHEIVSMAWPGGDITKISSFLSYCFLHGGFNHLFFNVIWMAAFGTALARRFGTARFLIFSAICGVAGAAAHLAAYWGDSAPLIGASAAISGQMSGSIRFVFEMGGPLGAFRSGSPHAYNVPASPLVESFSNPQVLGFVAVWFGINLLFGLWSAPLAGEGANIAWQAHVGGFVAGLILFRFFDPVKRYHPQ